MTIFVGNLSYKASEQDLNDLFSEYGTVSSVKIMKDNMTGRPRGFGFIEMEDDSAAEAAINALHEKEFMQRNLVVNKAQPRTSSGGDKPQRSFNRSNNRNRDND
jgi:RNA recognition motif-containing protein